MPSKYEYMDKPTPPDIDQIAADVNSSAMTDKTIEGCRYDQQPERLMVQFTNALDGSDKTELDTIVANNS